MKLYQYPLSTACRPIRLFVADHHMPVEMVEVDIVGGENRDAAFLAINANGCVPVLVDGDWSLTECSAILKYLADAVGSPTYPQERRSRATVNAAMDWFNTGFYQALGHQLVFRRHSPNTPCPIRPRRPRCSPGAATVPGTGSEFSTRTCSRGATMSRESSRPSPTISASRT